MRTKALRNGAIISFIISMGLLLIGGFFAKDKVPPIPGRVISETGELLITRDEILRGQNDYQRHGLMDHGSIWGHGSLRGMDFSATTLHQIGEIMRDYYASKGQYLPGAFSRVSRDQQTIIEAKVIKEIHTNRYDPSTDTLTLSEAQAFALQEIRHFWNETFRKGDPRYGFHPDTIQGLDSKIADFFFWTAWASGTNRPGLNFSYTNNWPSDRTVGNNATPQTLLWSVVSILALLLGLGIVVYIVHRYEFFYGKEKGVELAEKLLQTPLTPSQTATAKFFLVAGLLFVAQIFMGGLLAHYTVHPDSFYIPIIAKLIPYSWAKSWHLQLAIFWIAISWMGTAILLAPFIAGKEPSGQKLLVNILFISAFLVVVGSLLGEAASIKGLFPTGTLWYWFGHQGWEYLELGKLWQILLFGGLVFWLVVVYRPLASYVKNKSIESEQKSLVIFYVLSAILVVAFFGFGLFYGRTTHISIADYWRWFVVHIWVESIFEFFGVAVTALFLVSLGLVSAQSALRVAYLTAILVFLSGIPGTAHHYFWYGGPSFWLAIGGVFSSLEPIPLILLVTRAWMEYASIRKQGKEFPYRWPLYFLVASSFWNFLGAGVFGFLINLPIVNYYEHATYLTSNHGHTALFGVYGMLAISLILFSWRSLVQDKFWNDRILKISFWGLNGGLFLMFATTLLPIGLTQLWNVYTNGFWFARSADFYELPFVRMIALWRIVPDSIIIILGAFPLVGFLILTFLRLRQASSA